MRAVFLAALLLAAATCCTLGTATGCSDGVALGLSNQIVARLNQMGYKFKAVNATAIHCKSPGCFGFLQEGAAVALQQAAAAKHDYITLNSAFRSSASQYLLYKWWQEKRGCGIQLAAAPGTSNHESGRAIDTSFYTYWRPTLEQHGWKWFGTSDVVHFDYTGVPSLSKENLKAFQHLWNEHNPSAKIAEDGIYGPATANAFSKSPCGGW